VAPHLDDAPEASQCGCRETREQLDPVTAAVITEVDRFKRRLIAIVEGKEPGHGD
jgi:hypothetical protein